MFVNIDEDILVDVLLNRLSFWTDDEETHELFRQMYEMEIQCFEGSEFDPVSIVDNDYINFTTIISKDDNEDSLYDDIRLLFERQGLGDISCEHELNHGYDFIEAQYGDCFLLR